MHNQQETPTYVSKIVYKAQKSGCAEEVAIRR